MLDWAREYFERGYAQRWGLSPVSDRVRFEADDLWLHLRLKAGVRVVDLGCGHGRHAVALAHRGARVAGIDFAVTLLQHAKQLAADHDVRTHWLRGDIRRLPLRSEAAAGAILLDAFGFFETDDENEVVLHEAVRVLAPGGRLALKVVNGAPVLQSFREADREERNGVVVTISRRLRLDPPRMTEMLTVSGSRGDGEYQRRQRLYTSGELCGALERAGLTDVQVFGSSNGAPFESGTSPTMWVFGQRAAHAT
jgi:SAM-dependent methyltransferase